MKFVNLTPYDINICDANGTTIMVVPASGTVVHVETIVSSEKLADTGIPVEHTELAELFTLEEDGYRTFSMPAYDEDTTYIVSRMVLDKLKSMDKDIRNVYVTGMPIRDYARRIVGYIGLSK